MGLIQSDWPTACPRCGAEVDWSYSESVIDEQAQKQTAFFVPTCVRQSDIPRQPQETTSVTSSTNCPPPCIQPSATASSGSSSPHQIRRISSKA